MNQEKTIKILSKQRVYDGFFKIDQFELQHTLYNGAISKPLFREVFERGDAAAVLLADPELKKVVLIEQFRIGTIKEASASSAWLLEIVAGMIENNLSAEETAIKETQEETGLKINNLQKIMEFYPSPGGSTEKIHLYYSQVDATKVTPHCGAGTENEDINVLLIDMKTAFSWLKKGKINNAATIIALQWLQIKMMSDK